jgi:hypothetical protein
MRKEIIKLTCLIISLFFVQSIFAQIYDDSYLVDLPVNTSIYIKKNIKIPQGGNSILLDSGQGKVCSCQFFVSPVDYNRELKATRPLQVKKIEVKGLFDGSQMYAFRLYLNGSNDYFKLKCYTGQLQIKDFNNFFNLDYKEKPYYVNKDY